MQIVPERSATPDDVLRALFGAALDASRPERLIAHLPPPPKGRTVVVGAGKAAAAMARAVEARWPGPLSGLVVTRYGHGVPTERIEVVEAAHPVPDEQGQAAARRILDLARGLGPDDLLLCLISGGGSALLAAPAEGVTLADKQAVARNLLKSGASIREVNCVRKHLSAIKGGRLAAAAHPAQIVALILSDVPGDDPATVASGPTVADPTSFAEARAILARYNITAPPRVAAHLERAAEETPKPGDPRLAGVRNLIVGSAQIALEAAADEARRLGYVPLILSNSVEGEAREAAKIHAAIARQIRRHEQPLAPPCVVLSGGETTVTLRGDGQGGRNAEFALALALALDGLPGVWALAADTDGMDGVTDAAGAVVRPDSLARARAAGLDAHGSLDRNDAYGFFAKLGDLVKTGPTLTNVNDFRAMLVAGRAERNE